VLEQFRHLAPLPLELLRIRGVLILATTATTEQRAAWRHAVRRRCEHLDYVRLGKILVIPKNARADALAGQRERHHHDPFRVGLAGQRDPAQARTEIRERGDLQFDHLMVTEGLIVERFLFAHGTHGTHGSKTGEEKDFVFFTDSVSSVCPVGTPEKITSLQNPRVKQLVKLRDRRPRDEAGVFLVEGYREIRRALEKRVALRELYFSPEWFLGENEPALLAEAEAHGAELFELTKEAFAKVAYRERPDGLLAVAPQWKHALADLALPPEPFLLVVEAIEKPGNLGTILRSADAAGCDAVIVCDPVTDIFNPNVVRASTGVLFSVPLVVEESARVQAWLKEKRVRTIATTPAAEKIYSDVDLRGPLAVVMGSEQYGLSEFWLQHADVPVRIPMAGQADSLNVAMATIITLFEAVRQRSR
jgi:RNA methyltransferase, TrmH family